MKKSAAEIGVLLFDWVRFNLGHELIQKAAHARGHRVTLYLAEDFQYTFNAHNANRPGLLYKNEPFIPPDIMIIRPNVLADIDLYMSIVKQLQILGVPVLNNALPIVRAKNKIRTLQMLSHEGIPVPKTVVVSNPAYLDKAIAYIGRFPMIVKLAYGSFGNGVSILESRRSLRSFLDLFASDPSAAKRYVLIQEYVKEAKGKDIRVFVVGGKVIASMERRAPRGEFRANLHQGGGAGTARLSDEERSMALRSADILGLDIAGVDIIRTASGPKVLEVNSNPGLQGITEATGIDVGGSIIRLAEQRLFKKSRLCKDTMTMSG